MHFDDDVGMAFGQTLTRLKRYRFHSADDALESLAIWRERLTLMRLYQKYFPAEFARSKKKVAPSFDTGAGYSDREIEFLGLVNQRLFPILIPEDDLLRDERFPGIPLDTRAVEWYDYDGFESLRWPIQAFVALIGGINAEWWSEHFPAAPAILEGARDWERFKRLCRRAGGIFAAAPLALEVMSYSTANVFVDSTSDMGVPDTEWSERALSYLMVQWREAQALFARFDGLVDQLERDPAALIHLTELWNRAREPKGKNESTNPH